jgi:hypothetical protein
MKGLGSLNFRALTIPSEKKINIAQHPFTLQGRETRMYGIISKVAPKRRKLPFSDGEQFLNDKKIQ